MPAARRIAPPVLLACLLLAGCKPSLATSASSAPRPPAAGASATAVPAGAGESIAVGAGPQKHYTVQ